MELSSVFRGKHVLWTFIIVTLLASVTMVNVASATPEPYFSVDPTLIEGTPEGKFEVNITITGAPDTYAWEIYVSWNPALLELGYIKQGDFLHRWKFIPVPPPGRWVPKYGTSFVYVPLDEANVEGQVIVGCTLTGDPATADWASGDGWLCTLGFTVEAEGEGDIDLFDTRLADYLDVEGYPAYTEHGNVDGHVVTSAPFCSADLYEWKLKVNKAAGEGKGHKSTVGKENLLEAWVKNTGPFDVYVQVLFEIRDSAGFWIATVESDIAGPLSSGELTTPSATWTAGEPDVYYITAYLFYSMFGPPFAPTIPDSFSQTLSLRVDTLPK